MPLLNPTLRDAGPTPGSAAGWSLTSLCRSQRIATFGPAPPKAREDFERWNDFVSSFDDGPHVLAFFDLASNGFEDFEHGWNAGAFVRDMSDALLQPFPFVDGVEAFEGWLASPLVTQWSKVASEVALFDGAPVDDFEGWLIPAIPAWAGASFDAGANSAETFEGPWTVMKTL